jgi:hypothetical protein
MTITGASVDPGPTVILIGGRMTLEDGGELDSRQPVEGDPWSRVARMTMASSLLWWMTTSSLVEAILESAGPDAFALVDGPRLLAELRPDGNMRQRRLGSALTGGVSKLGIGVSGPKGRLDSKYQPLVENAPMPGYRIGIDFVPGARWQLLEPCFPGLLAHVLPAIGPAVIVDTGAVPYAMPYASFEAERLRGGMTLVLPHSNGGERHIRNVLEWVRSGRPPNAEEQHEEWSREGDARSWAPIREASIPIAVEFGVTGLYRDGDWRDPANLEAARAFVQTRFDLRIGIWDLAENPSLRTSLLEPTPVRPAPIEPASVPKGSTKRASEYVEAQHENEQKHDAFRRSMKRPLTALEPLGWTSPVEHEQGVVDVRVGPDNPYLRLPLTEPIRVGDDMRPLAWLSLGITKHATRISIDYTYDLHVSINDVRPYLDSKSSLLLEIAKPGKCKFRYAPLLLWEAKGGWGDDIDWTSRVAELHEKTTRWLEVLADLRLKLLDAYGKRIESHRETP